MNHESFIFSWLTYGWLIENLDIIIIVLLSGVTLLFVFPILLGYDIKKESDRKNLE